MCTVCGCNDASHEHAHKVGHQHSHDHAGQLHFGTGPAGVDAAGLSQHRLVEIETDILAGNNRYAAQNRQTLKSLGVFAVNLLSSPGSGKTTLLCKTIEALQQQPLAVIEGDQQTIRDAERIREAGAPAIQVNTGKGCHLDAHMVGHALESLPLDEGAMLFIENVGNLVCPAAFNLGEDCKVTMLSVTEGEDKPLKYPDIFTASQLAIISKTDLASHCDVDLDLIKRNLTRINPGIEIISLSARTGEGMSDWIDWIREKQAAFTPTARQQA